MKTSEPTYLITENFRSFNFDSSQLDKSKIINLNESKTPLAHVHAGAFRRIFLHFQLEQQLLEAGFEVSFSIGNDDYDPYDYFPNYFDEKEKDRYRPFLGYPLSSVPAPVGGGSYADYYFDEMIENLHQIFGIKVKTYKTSELYKNGFFDDGIRLILNNLNKLNEAYESMTGIKDKFNEKPLQIICPGCGNMRTTTILDYKDGKVNVSCGDYVLRNVKFIGCGFTGWTTPYGGNGRLFWKLEWPVRWYYMAISIEGSRKDQNSDLGARKFAESVFETLFSQHPPKNLPYDFCYVRSENSPQINRFGISLGEALKFLPPQLFFDLLTKQPNGQPVDINLESGKMLDIYKEYAKRSLGDKNGELFNQLLEDVRFDRETECVTQQASLAKCLKHYLHVSQAEEAWHLDLTHKRPDGIEHHFLKNLEEGLTAVDTWQASALQHAFGDAATKSNIPLQQACKIVYKSLINRQAGLRIGILFEKIGQTRLLNHLQSC